MVAPTIQGPIPDIIERLDAYSGHDLETEFQIRTNLGDLLVARCDWVRSGEVLFDLLREAREEILRLRALSPEARS